MQRWNEAGYGRHILLLNNDTLLTPFWLTRMVASFTFQDTGIVGPMSSILRGSKISMQRDTLQRFT